MSENIEPETTEENARSRNSAGTHCYVVVAREDYEGDTITRAYTDEESAKKFCELCNKHQQDHINCPTNEDDHEWGLWEDSHRKWCEEHPASGHESSSEEFIILKTTIYT